MVKKVTIIFGSPRKESNTHILVKEAQRGLKDIGMESQVFFLNDLNFKGCQSCFHCKAKDTTECAIKDDMQKIHGAMEASDGLIVASPIYFGNVTSLVKAWEDRLFTYHGPGHNLGGHKKAAFIFTQNSPDEKAFRATIEGIMGIVKLIGLEPAGCLVAANLMKGMKPMVTENPVLMNAAYELGKGLFGTE